MMKKVMQWVAAGLVLAAAAAPVPAQPITVAPGNDGWRTPAGSSKVDLSVFPIQTFFGTGAVVTPTIVSLSGSPLAPPLGSIDTLLERTPPSVTFATFPETHTFTVGIKGLRLRGQTNIDGTTYDLVVALSETSSGTGTITATRLTPDGGRFSSSFPVLPKLIFTEVGNPANRVVIDCGLVAGCPAPLTLGASNVCWEVAFGPNGFDPATKGITPIPAGIAIDGTFNGVNDYTTVGRKRAGFAGLEFHAGYNPAPPWGLCGGTGTFQHDHAVYSLTHVSAQATDCPPVTTGTPSPDPDPGTPDTPGHTLNVTPGPVQGIDCPAQTRLGTDAAKPPVKH
jgi:hypothetical protein